MEPGASAHTSNPSYLGGRHQDCGLKPAQIVLKTLSWKKPITQKKGWQSGSRCRPWVQAQYHKKKKKQGTQIQRPACHMVPTSQIAMPTSPTSSLSCTHLGHLRIVLLHQYISCTHLGQLRIVLLHQYISCTHLGHLRIVLLHHQYISQHDGAASIEIRRKVDSDHCPVQITFTFITLSILRVSFLEWSGAHFTSRQKAWENFPQKKPYEWERSTEKVLMSFLSKEMEIKATMRHQCTPTQVMTLKRQHSKRQ
jgi:hypothetical protein